MPPTNIDECVVSLVSYILHEGGGGGGGWQNVKHCKQHWLSDNWHRNQEGKQTLDKTTNDFDDPSKSLSKDCKSMSMSMLKQLLHRSVLFSFFFSECNDSGVWCQCWSLKSLLQFLKTSENAEETFPTRFKGNIFVGHPVQFCPMSMGLSPHWGFLYIEFPSNCNRSVAVWLGE